MNKSSAHTALKTIAPLQAPKPARTAQHAEHHLLSTEVLDKILLTNGAAVLLKEQVITVETE